MLYAKLIGRIALFTCENIAHIEFYLQGILPKILAIYTIKNEYRRTPPGQPDRALADGGGGVMCVLDGGGGYSAKDWHPVHGAWFSHAILLFAKCCRRLDRISYGVSL